MAESASEIRLLGRSLYVLIGLLYVSAFPYHPKLRSPNELSRLWQARALVEYGTLDINQALRDYGYVGDLSVKDGKFYPSKAPLLSFTAAPIYAVLRAYGGGYRYAVPEITQVYWSRLFLTVLPTLAILAWVHRFLRTYLSQAVASGLAATYALGSLAFSYSLLFISHQTTAVFLFASFYALWRCARGEWRERGYVLAGAFAGAAIAAEYTAGLGIAGLVLYGVLSCLMDPAEPIASRLIRLTRAAVLAVVGALPLVAALMLYHWKCFGHPLQSGYLYLADPGYQPWHLGGFLGIHTPDPSAFVLSLFSPLRGFFTLAPFLMLAIPGYAIQFRSSRGRPADRALFWFTALLFLGYLYFTSSFTYASWGWSTGPRHLTPLVPFLLLPCGLCIQWFRELPHAVGRVLTAVAAGLCAVSVVITGSLSLVDYVPDSMSNGFFGLAMPLFRGGDLPPSLWAFVGIPNPASGVFTLLLLAAGAVLVLWQLTVTNRVRQTTMAVVGLVTVCAYLSLFSMTYRNDPGDAAALGHLRSVWLTPPGVTLAFWPHPKR